MQICTLHYEQLKQAIKARGLWDLVAQSKEEQQKVIEATIQGGDPKKETFDPLLSANNAIWSHAIKVGGLYLLTTKPDGTQYCPVCEADAHGQPGWIEKAADGSAQQARLLHLTPEPDSPA